MTSKEENNSQIDRRNLLKGIGIAGSAAVLAPLISTAGLSGAQAATANFTGKTVRVAVGSFMSSGAKLFVDAWEAKTGGKVEVIEIPFGDLYSKLNQAFSSGVDAYDVVIYASGWISGFAKNGYIASLEPYYPTKSNWDAVLPKLQKVTQISGKRYTVPLDGDLIMMYYRLDAFENPVAKKKFKALTKRELTIPATWSEYIECAKFFTGWDWAKNGKPCYGVLEAMKPNDVGVFIFNSHASAYSAHPDHPGTFFFQPGTMKPQIDNPGWIQALNDWKTLKKYGPPQMITYGGGDQRSNFVAGNYALALDWPDIGILAQDESQSIVKNLLGYAQAPGSSKVWNYTSKKWDNLPKINKAPYMAWGGWHASIASTSTVKDAAWDFADFIDSDANSLTAVTTPGTARGPYRKQHFQPQVWKDSSVKFVNPEAYLKAQLDGFNDSNVNFDLRIPEAGQYFQVLDAAIQIGLSGSQTPREALTKAAKEWDKITTKVGKTSQSSFNQDLEIKAAK